MRSITGASCLWMATRLVLDKFPPVCYLYPMSETCNSNSSLDPQNEIHDLAKVTPEEGFNHGAAAAEVLDEFCAELDSNFGGCEGQWPGDGSGIDDLADFNAMEGFDN